MTLREFGTLSLIIPGCKRAVGGKQTSLRLEGSLLGGKMRRSGWIGRAGVEGALQGKQVPGIVPPAWGGVWDQKTKRRVRRGANGEEYQAHLTGIPTLSCPNLQALDR